MTRTVRLLSLMTLAAIALATASCESDGPPRGPTDSSSDLPWNRPLPGERSPGPLGALPFQSR